MDLKTYLFKNNMKRTEFAKELGICRNHIFHIFRGNCSPEMAKRIEKFTQGQVTELEARPPRKDLRTREMREKRDRTRNQR